ncbi:MipA/OmpV family protein [Arsukibacterium indicum]|uniref:MipA/OmpV family protein n=1 Tax=Arsukibacterium indicum TaxID=2848612 RepID=A0ABS6MLC7_9GAMM|nr:MipA/OmpV family protein [Arsukibacterium indicum]MBV2129621.1 MipA/OmpV family protein [Arsukibacterium indicum]
MDKIRRYFITLLLAFAGFNSSTGHTQQGQSQNSQQPPQGFLYGVGIGINQEIYRGYKRRTIPLPLIGYRGEKLSVYGPFVSYQLLQHANFSVSAKLAPRFAGFDESDSNVFAGMAKRKSSLDGGIGVQYRLQSWVVEAETLVDLLGNSNGQESKLAVGYNMRFGPVLLEPKVGISYADSKLVDYYYGVRLNEATSSRMPYSAKSAFNYNAGISLSTPVFFGGMTRLGIEHHWYDTSISNSPLTDRDSGVSAFLSWSKFF